MTFTIFIYLFNKLTKLHLLDMQLNNNNKIGKIPIIIGVFLPIFRFIYTPKAFFYQYMKKN